jgi:HAD superfamily hydrolase (TIGR01662 family)
MTDQPAAHPPPSSSIRHSSSPDSSPIKAVLLDFGHTLVNYEADEAALLESYKEIHAFLDMAEVSREPIPDDLMLRVFRHLTEVITQSYVDGQIEELDCIAIYDDAFRHHGYQLDRELLHRVLELDHRALASQFEVPASTLEALRRLRERGYLIGIVSNATPTGTVMRHDLEVLGLAELIDAATYSSECGFRKPHPRIYLSTTEQLGVQPAECVFVGDRVKEDIRGSQALGMRAVLSQQFRQEEAGDSAPLAVIRELPELVEVLERLKVAQAG